MSSVSPQTSADTILAGSSRCARHVAFTDITERGMGAMVRALTPQQAAVGLTPLGKGSGEVPLYFRVRVKAQGS